MRGARLAAVAGWARALVRVFASRVLRWREAVSSPCREPTYFLLLAQEKGKQREGHPAYAVLARLRAPGTRLGTGFSAVLPAPSKRARHPCRAPCGRFHSQPLGFRGDPRSKAVGSLRIALGSFCFFAVFGKPWPLTPALSPEGRGG